MLGTQSDVNIRLLISLEISHFLRLEKERWPWAIHSHRWLPGPSPIFFLGSINPTQHRSNLTIQSTAWPDSDFPDPTSQGQPDQPHGWTKSLEGLVSFGGPSLPQSMNLLSQEVCAVSKRALALQHTSAPRIKV